MANKKIVTTMATHIGTRSYQQDAAYVSECSDEGITYGILCDGMGGMHDGERAASSVVAFVANRIAGASGDESLPDFLDEMIHVANDLVVRLNEATGQTSGTTLLITLIRGDHLYWGSVGDSRIYIIRGNEIAQVTQDHNYGLELAKQVAQGIITQEEADCDPAREHLISYIGAPFLPLIDINKKPFSMLHGDVVLLCSDGLTKVLSEAEILSTVNEHCHALNLAAEALCLNAFNNSPGSLDNTTVVLMRYTTIQKEENLYESSEM